MAILKDIFNLFSRKPYSYDELMERSREFVNAAMEGDDPNGQLFRNMESHSPKLLKEWWAYYEPDIKEISEAESLFEQHIKIRKAIIEEVKAYFLATYFLYKKKKEKDKRVLAKKFNPETKYKDYIQIQKQTWLYSAASSLVFRLIGTDFKDTRENDWYTGYCQFYEVQMEFTWDSIIAHEQGDFTAFDALTRVGYPELEKMEQKILEGYNWDFTDGE